MKNRFENINNPNYAFIPRYLDIKKVMTVVLLQCSFGEKKLYTIYKGFLWLWRSVITNYTYYRTDFKSNSDFLMFYGQFNYRDDHSKTFKAFSERFEDADIIKAEKNEKKCFHPIILLKYVVLGIVWFIQLIAERTSVPDALATIPFLCMCNYHCNFLEKIDTERYKFVVAYCDVSPDENCFIQYFNNKEITTMTLQHGIFAKKPTPHNASETGFELYASISDFYLAWNKYTFDEAKIAGLSADKIRILGIPKYINYSKPEGQIFSDNNTFGIVLNSKQFDKHNREMINIANQISEKYDYRFLVRYHPQLKGDEYIELYGKGYCGNNDNKRSIADYAKTVQFTIISSSSVFVDLLFLNHPVYRKIVSKQDTYSNVELFSFDTIDDFDCLLQMKNSNSDIFAYLCTSYDIYGNYRKFFDEIINNEKNEICNN